MLFILAMYGFALSQLIAAFSVQYWQFCLYSVVFGLCDGCFVGQLATVVAELVPCKKKVGTALGNTFAIISIPIATGPVVAGMY